MVGHSERRQLYGETDAQVGAKIKQALAAGLSVIACVGETLAQREADQTMAIVGAQLAAIAAAASSSWTAIVIAYEVLT